MEKYLIKRTGESPLSFEGNILAESNGRWAGGKEQNRWHDVTLYETETHKYVLSIEYHTLWQGELDHYYAQFADSVEELKDLVRYYSPEEFVQGFPPHPHYSEKQANLLNWIRRRFDAQIAEIFNFEKFAEQI